MQFKSMMARESLSQKCVIQFRAGKMLFEDGKVVPDRRRGTLSFYKEANEVKIIWTSGGTTERFTLPRGQVKFSKVEKCKTGRVLLFEFETTQPPLFFWIQEKSTENDSTYISTIQELVSQTQSSLDESCARLGSVLKSVIHESNEDRVRDIEFVDVITSKKMVDALREDPAFYMSRLHQFLPDGTDPTSDVVEEVMNPQVYSSTVLLGLTLRDPTGFHDLCSLFKLEGSRPGVLSFINSILRECEKK
ncbi:putative Proteasome complex subunit Rpn13 ubiquitin receptor [Trypanosoma vivax]|uniref:Pru domain-containing protein n=1 Tax=Trypanosoma vivax (strain Y486) TaxID=1055687 RepID=G0U3Q4_TRYVY|nr:hypothetical protein TRVL_03755 [Trypanosoma vivax]KAH8613851.1 putative Proteasome complex subunit Rpn13 ubiquitin receptor [Trypanosoma vivax]CCC50913.1 conserved hypothetical protein [Trypanosoma vivax Y486]